MPGGQAQFQNQYRGGNQQYRQKAGGQGFQNGPQGMPMGGPQMFATVPMGGMPAVMNMGMGPMNMGGQL